MTKAERRYHDIVRSLGCVICREFFGVRTPPEVHHVAEGSSKRYEYMVAGLCFEHHQGATGIHGLGSGPKAFLMRFRLASEYSLLGLVNQFRMEDGV